MITKALFPDHQKPLYFSVFPDEADRYLAAVEQAEKEAEEYEEQIYTSRNGLS